MEMTRQNTINKGYKQALCWTAYRYESCCKEILAMAVLWPGILANLKCTAWAVSQAEDLAISGR
jgi:hypothetical protein